MKRFGRYGELIKVALITFLVYLGFRFLLPLFFPFLLAYFIAWLLKRPVRFMAKKLRIRPAIGGGILLILFVVLIGGGLFYGISRLVEQLVLFVGNYTVYRDMVGESIQQLCCYCDGFFGLTDGSTFHLLGKGMEGISKMLQEEFIPSLTQRSIQAAISVTEIAAAVIIIFVAAVLFVVDMANPELKQEFEEGSWRKEWSEIRKELSTAGIAYLKTQLTLLLLVSIICSIGFLIMKNPYALLFGVGVGVLDALPIIGSGLILVPWAVICFVQGNVFSGAVLLSMYGGCQFVREYLEPKLLGGKIGIRPVFSLMAIFIGYELFGIAGIFLGPIGLVLIRAVNRRMELHSEL